MKNAARRYAFFEGVVMQVRGNFLAIHFRADPVEVQDLDERPSDSLPLVILVSRLPGPPEL